MQVQSSVPAQPIFVINERKLAELIHKETDTRASGADYLGQRFLTVIYNDRLRHALLPKVAHQQQHPRQPRLTGIKRLIHQLLLDPDQIQQQIRT